MKNTLVNKYNSLTARYNTSINQLKKDYDIECNVMRPSSSEKRKIKKSYSDRYQVLEKEYEEQRKLVMEDYKTANPRWATSRTMFNWLFYIGIAVAFVGFVALMPLDEGETQEAVSSAMSEQKEVYWNADNIEIPYLKDSTQYVANPDYVLSQNAVDQMNVTLQKLEKQLGVQSVFIVVNHIENDDPFRFAQDIGNKYGVGHNDLGLVVVVGYLDHKINMSPGRKLEADLTDAECYRLEQEYVVPAMRAEMPDSGMIYLADAIFSKLQKKELPQMSSLASMDDDDATIPILITLFLLVMCGWGGWFLVLNNKYLWFPTSSLQKLRGNPFDGSGDYYRSRRGYHWYSGGGSSWGGGSSSSGGGGFSGGSFGGGSFGGGGATSSW